MSAPPMLGVPGAGPPRPAGLAPPPVPVSAAVAQHASGRAPGIARTPLAAPCRRVPCLQPGPPASVPPLPVCPRCPSRHPWAACRRRHCTACSSRPRQVRPLGPAQPRPVDAAPALESTALPSGSRSLWCAAAAAISAAAAAAVPAAAAGSSHGPRPSIGVPAGPTHLWCQRPGPCSPCLRRPCRHACPGHEHGYGPPSPYPRVRGPAGTVRPADAAAADGPVPLAQPGTLGTGAAAGHGHRSLPVPSTDRRPGRGGTRRRAALHRLQQQPHLYAHDGRCHPQQRPAQGPLVAASWGHGPAPGFRGGGAAGQPGLCRDRPVSPVPDVHQPLRQVDGRRPQVPLQRLRHAQ